MIVHTETDLTLYGDLTVRVNLSKEFIEIQNQNDFQLNSFVSLQSNENLK